MRDECRIQSDLLRSSGVAEANSLWLLLRSPPCLGLIWRSARFFSCGGREKEQMIASHLPLFCFSGPRSRCTGAEADGTRQEADTCKLRQHGL